MLWRLVQHQSKRVLGPGPGVLLVQNVDRNDLKRWVALAIASRNAPPDDCSQDRNKMICLYRCRAEFIAELVDP